MDDTAAATTPSPSPAAATAAGYDAARDKTNEGVAAAAAVAANSIRLLIKSSNQQYDDMNIESDLCWTVQRLKKQLSLVYPGKPEINDQKLIYSGKLLDDAQKLSEVIRSYKDVYQQHHIFHLVCANKNIAKAPYKATMPPKDTTPTAAPRRVDTNVNDNELRQRHMAAAVAAAAAQIPYQQPNLQQTIDSHPWLQLQNQAYQMAAAQGASASASTSATSQMAFQRQQVLLYNAWIQQWYAVYMQQTMQRTSGTGGVVPPAMLPPFMQGMPGLANNMGVPLVGHQPVPVAGATGPGAGQPNEEAAAQQPAARQVDGLNFPNIQEEPEMRDWLDSFFSFTRLAIFVTVLYFNSSPMRCLLVVLIASVIYLYHIGVLRRRRERNNNNINRNNNAGGNNNAAFAAVQQIQRMMDAAVEHDNNPQAAAEPAPVAAQEDAARPPAPASAGAEQADAAAAAAEAVAVEPANANNSVISIVRTFVITFFTSLLPEAPAL
ncbi:homocysteine-responsive endoplasmic reticulum-resident ubiquitin-like domain member 2 protein [Drosophila virilis]|uniref:Ubiquitin-like domain-containing protein n=1 Tax=Drosophila virilis TaxID=7244 RepID=B4LSS4_DROVI|nr:homocysteine-responsive endoplasmic reticulum-resident ubiquitin-like domain member 2 protein [Drosophila virilis]EDW63813.1 uncharacterized protein Dvir_GJ16764 [Drosophila virilis]